MFSEAAKREVEREPLSFLRIDRAETLLPDDVDIYADEVYKKAHELLWEMVGKGEFQVEKTIHLGGINGQFNSMS